MSLSRQKVAETIRRLRYDFESFTLDDFVAYVAARRGKSIEVEYPPLAPDLFAMWISAPYGDYIFVNSTKHPIHQVHSVLHETGHMLLNHPLHSLDHILSPEMLRLLRLETAVGRARYIPEIRLVDTPEEREAEEFVFHIQERVAQMNRLKTLAAEGSSIETLLPLIRTGA